MLRKLINKIIMGTKCYSMLKEKFRDNELLIESLTEELKKSSDSVSKNKTTARKIIRVVNGLIKREDSVQATKEIKALCNEIIKGE